MKKILIVVVLLLVIVAGAYGITWWRSPKIGHVEDEAQLATSPLKIQKAASVRKSV